MREIKFRGRRVDTGEWVYGGFHKHQKYTPSPIIPNGEEPKEPEYAYLVIESGFSDWNMPKPILGHEVDPATVGQYTGLKDKNGVEIYEGDKLHVWDTTCSPDNNFSFIGAVSYKYAEFGFENVDQEEWAQLAIVTCEGIKCEVIGNIYDNSELPEGGQA